MTPIIGPKYVWTFVIVCLAVSSVVGNAQKKKYPYTRRGLLSRWAPKRCSLYIIGFLVACFFFYVFVRTLLLFSCGKLYCQPVSRRFGCRFLWPYSIRLRMRFLLDFLAVVIKNCAPVFGFVGHRSILKDLRAPQTSTVEVILHSIHGRWNEAM